MSAFFRRGPAGLRALPVWCRGAPRRQAYVMFRKEFTLKKRPERAVVQVSAMDRYILLVNGVPVGRGPACGAGRVRFYDVFEDAGPLLERGDNVVAALVYSHGPDERNRIMETEGCFILRLSAEFGEGPGADVSTDTSWKAAVCPAWIPAAEPINRWGVGYPEDFDPGLMPRGWDLPGFDDSGWERAELRTLSGLEWRPRPVPSLRYELLPPRAVEEKRPGGGKIKGGVRTASGKGRGAKGLVLDACVPGAYPMVVLDFGRVVPARPRLRLKAPEDGGEMEVYYGETRRLEPVDRVRLRKGEYEWGPFLPRGFRFLGLAVRNAPGPVTVVSAEAEVERFDFRSPPGKFSSDDRLLGKIFDTARATLESSTRDYFMDCPGREQALWLGDVARADAAALAVFGDPRPGRHSMDLFALAQEDDGRVPAVGPYSGDEFIPDFHMQWPWMLYRHYLYTGELEFLEERFASLSRSLAWLERVLDRKDLVPRAERPEWWCFLDWQDALPKSGYSAALNILAFGAFRAGALAAEALSRLDQAARWGKFAVSMDIAVKQAFFSRKKGLFSNTPAGGPGTFSQLANALAICTGLVMGKEAERLGKRMVSAKGLVPVATPYAAYWYAEALFSAGLAEEGLDFVRRYWGGMVERGAGTFWETFDPETPRCRTPFGDRRNVVSLCHGWGAAVAELMVRHLAGVEPLEPGFGRVRFRPAVGVLERLSVEAALPWGRVKTSFSRKGNRCRVELRLPEEREVETVLAAPGLERLSLGKREVYSREGPVVLPEGVTAFSARDGALTFRTSTGRLLLGLTFSEKGGEG